LNVSPDLWSSGVRDVLAGSLTECADNGDYFKPLMAGKAAVRTIIAGTVIVRTANYFSAFGFWEHAKGWLP
jgi:hypothetical protein